MVVATTNTTATTHGDKGDDGDKAKERERERKEKSVCTNVHRRDKINIFDVVRQMIELN